MSEVLCLAEQGVIRVVINRPGQRNALNPTVLALLSRAFASASADPLVRVITLSGAGDDVFCAGADLKASRERTDAGSGFLRAEYRNLLVEIRRCPKLTVALARGHVLGGGLGLLLACDLALACDDIHIATPEINVGMFPMMVMTLLFRHVGRKKGTEMLLLGERITALAARDAGILNAVFPRGDFDREAESYVRKLTGKSASVLGIGKQAMLEIQDRGLDEELHYLELELQRVMATEDSREGLLAFLEKRDPWWSGR